MQALYSATLATALTASLAFSAPAFAADDGETLFKKNGCYMCHNDTNKNLGPAPKMIAAKYAGDDTAQAMLEKKVRTGGSGTWGKLTMPPIPKKVTDENIRDIVRWILSQK